MAVYRLPSYIEDITDITNRSHANLQNLSADDHTGYARLAGRAAGQTFYGGSLTGTGLMVYANSVDANAVMMYLTGTGYGYFQMDAARDFSFYFGANRLVSVENGALRLGRNVADYYLDINKPAGSLANFLDLRINNVSLLTLDKDGKFSTIPASAVPWAGVNKTGSNLSDLATKSHTSLSDIGTTTHTNIDTHIGTKNIHWGGTSKVIQERIYPAGLGVEANITGLTYTSIDEIATNGGIYVEFTVNFDESIYTNCDYEWVFEAYLRVGTAARTGYIQLYNQTDGVAITGSEMTHTGDTNWTKKSCTISSANLPTTGTKTFRIQLKNDLAGAMTYSRRIMIIIRRKIQA